MPFITILTYLPHCNKYIYILVICSVQFFTMNKVTCLDKLATRLLGWNRTIQYSFKTGVNLKSLFQSMKVAFTSPRSQNIIPKTLFDFVPKDHGYILQK